MGPRARDPFGHPELLRAREELEEAYQLFNWATDPRLIDEAIHRIRVAELRLDRVTRP